MQFSAKYSSSTISLAQWLPCTEAEGPGKRFALWVQGCPFRCAGCCNPEMLSTQGGQKVSIAWIISQLQTSAEKNSLDGITLLGGEPFAQPGPLAQLAQAAHAIDLTVMIFSGYTREVLEGHVDSGVKQLFSETDILVDGLYNKDRPEFQRRWIGSSNQKIHFLTDRVEKNDPRWQRSNTLEIRLEKQSLTINGFPAAHAKQFWRRIPVSQRQRPKNSSEES
ncbi:Pyruvate formate-lyase 1-activating enzyme [Planctomycetales bacterium 10988]|nr:Pyruvate formate-lyase 1-activating enzyme [Planctomycetales bacterium 10988]